MGDVVAEGKQDEAASEVKPMSREQIRALKDFQRQEKEREKAEKKARKEQAKAEKEALKHDKELKREQAEAEKEKKRREKEAKRQHEEAMRQEKEALERKKQASLQKQANIMNRFFRKDQAGVEASPPQPLSSSQTPPPPRRSVIAMDMELAGDITCTIDELFRKHLTTWKTIRSGGKVLRWGMRRAPKVQLFKELRIQESKVDVPSTSEQGSPAPTPQPRSSRRLRMKLLQFHKCFRPAYYGTFSRKSKLVGPRHPLRKEPSLEYEIDSDDEWEEEAPGESLSDCDDVEEEEKLDPEEDTEDEFVVPDGYLSDNEGIEVERINELASSSNEGQKELHNILKFVTERALKTNRAFILENFAGDSTPVEAESVRECCLQALSIQVLAPDVFIQPPDPREEEDSRVEAEKKPTPKTGAKRGRKSSASLVEAALPEIVQVLHGFPQGMKKTVEMLSQKFPRIAKAQIELKIREISDYVDGRWKVKDEFLSVVQVQKKTRVNSEDSPESNLPAIPCKPLSNLSQKRCLPLGESSLDAVHKLCDERQ